MIGYNTIGYLGRLGNQMFQFASLKGIARNKGYEYCIPHSKNENEYQDHQLSIPFKLKNVSSLNFQCIDEARPTVVEDGFCYDKNLFENCPDWVNVHGYFQTEKYFKHIEKEIKEDFEFVDEILEPCKEMIEGIDNPISIHVRRTDYVTNPNHTSLSLDYYQKALKEFDSDATVLLFSDDPKWCAEQELFSDDRFMIAEGNSNYVDMCLMTLCSGHIIANSSFSWWGAWLANSKKVIAPDGWFKGSKNEHLDTKDIIPNNWVKL